MNDYDRLVAQNNMLDALVRQQGFLIAELKEKLERKEIDNQNLMVRARFSERKLPKQKESK